MAHAEKLECEVSIVLSMSFDEAKNLLNWIDRHSTNHVPGVNDGPVTKALREAIEA